MSDSEDINDMLSMAVSQQHIPEGIKKSQSRRNGFEQKRSERTRLGRGAEAVGRGAVVVGRGAEAVGRGAEAVGRANSSGSEGYQSALEEEEEAPRVVVAAEPPELLCDKIDNEFFDDPVVTAEGFTHSRGLVEAWFAKSDISPDTGRVMDDNTLRPNILVRQMVDAWKEANPGYKEGGFINKKARKSRRKSRNKKNRNRRTKSKSRN